jgi:hypothetical protein
MKGTNSRNSSKKKWKNNLLPTLLLLLSCYDAERNWDFKTGKFKFDYRSGVKKTTLLSATTALKLKLWRKDRYCIHKMGKWLWICFANYTQKIGRKKKLLEWKSWQLQKILYLWVWNGWLWCKTKGTVTKITD